MRKLRVGPYVSNQVRQFVISLRRMYGLLKKNRRSKSDAKYTITLLKSF
jgi:hypothetical protein